MRAIGTKAFYKNTTITAISLPSTLKSIGTDAFANCTSLRTADIPTGVETLDTRAFYGCSSLDTVSGLAGVKSIGYAAFYNCSALKTISLAEKVTYLGDHAFAGCRTLNSIAFSPGLTYLGKYAFKDCDGLTSVSIPVGITVVNDYVFSYCDNLKSARLPSTVTTVNYAAFYACTSLAALIFEGNKPSIGSYALSKCSDLLTVYYYGARTGWISYPDTKCNTSGNAYYVKGLNRLTVEGSTGGALTIDAGCYFDQANSYAAEGSTVNFAVKPGYIVTNLSYISSTVKTNLDLVSRSFIMPAANTTLSAIYTRVLSLAVSVESGSTSTNNTKPTWSWTTNSTDGITGRYRYQMDGNTENGWTITTGMSYSPASTLSDGLHTLYVQEEYTDGTWSESKNAGITIREIGLIISPKINEIYNVDVTVNNIASFQNRTFTLTYDSAALEIVDLCAYTKTKELAAGEIAGTGITILDVSSGKITLKADKAVPSGKNWSGVINVLLFRALTNQPTTIKLQ